MKNEHALRLSQPQRWGWGMVVILAIVFSWNEGLAQGGSDQKAASGVGLIAPDFILRGLNGKTVRLSSLRGKKAVLLNFWATWCPPCRSEMPTMEKIYREYESRGLEILAVSIDSGPESVAAVAVEKFMVELELTFPALLDPRMEVATRYKLLGLPMTVLIDRRGTIRGVEVGYRDWSSAESRKKIESLLKSP
jgi:peroxiredoxin